MGKSALNGGPLLTVKLTCFEGGGCILGLVANHVVFDGWTFAMFMRDWSAIHAGQQVPPAICEMSAELCKPSSREDFLEFIKTENKEAFGKGWLVKLLFTSGAQLLLVVCSL